MVGPTPAEYLREHTVHTVQVTRVDGTRFQLQDPRVFNDTLTGLRDSGQAPDSLAVAMSEIQTLAVRKIDMKNTVSLIGTIYVVAALTAYAAGAH